MPSIKVKLADGTWHLYQNVPETVTPEEVVARAEKEFGQPIEEVEKQRSLLEATKTYASDFFRGAGRAVASTLEGAAAFNYAERMGRPPEPGREITQAVNEALPTPKGDSGGRRAVRATLEGVGGAAVSPAGLAAPGMNLATGGAAGLGGWAGGELTGGNPIAEVVGSLLGGGLAASTGAMRSTAPELARDVVEGVDPVHLSQAQQRMRAAQQAGVPINLSQAMPRPSNIDDMVDALASSRHGDLTQRQLRNQPELLSIQARIAGANVPGEHVAPQAAANAAQDAATAAIKGAQGRANTAFRSKLPPGTEVPVDAIKAFDKRLADFAAANPNTQAAAMAEQVRKALYVGADEAVDAVPVGAGKVSSRLTQPVAAREREWITDASKLKNAIDDRISAYGSSQLNDPRNAKFVDRAANQIRTLFDRSVAPVGSPLREARAAAREVYVGEVNPMKKSVTGRLAGLTGAKEDREAVASKLTSVFDRGTPEKGTSEILTLEKDLRKVDPNVFPDAVKTHISERLAKILPVENARVSDDFAAQVKKALAANPNQERGLRDMLAGVARSKGLPENQVVNGFMNFIKLSILAERRPPKISGLPLRDLQEVAGKSAMATTLESQYLGRVGTKIRMGLSGDAYRTMDKLLTTPEGVDMLLQLAKEPIMSKKAAYLITTFYASQGQDSGPVTGQ